MAAYLSALLICLKPLNLILIFAMVTVGIIFGAIPGLSATLGIALRHCTFTPALDAQGCGADPNEGDGYIGQQPGAGFQQLCRLTHALGKEKEDQAGHKAHQTCGKITPYFHRFIPRCFKEMRPGGCLRASAFRRSTQLCKELAV